MFVMKIDSRLGGYEVHIGPINDFLKTLSHSENHMFLVDENVSKYYSLDILGELPQSRTVILPALEDGKTLEGVQTVYDCLLDHSAKRNLTLVTIGGGILQDVTGFVASTLYRGVKWILIPTTLLSQADSCIGSKTSLNYKGFKNLIGSFYPPSSVWIDPYFLGTLSIEDFYSGLGEVVKLHIIGGDRNIQQLLNVFDSICARDVITLRETIQTSLEIKKSYITDDEFDLGRRNMLNYGHCFGHAIETVSDFRVPHGQAIVVGMILANYIAFKRGLLSKKRCSFIEERLLIPSLHSKLLPKDLNSVAIIEAMGKDKKRTGRGLVLVMTKDSEEMVRVDDLEADEVLDALKVIGKRII